MSDLGASIKAVALPTLETLSGDLSEQFISGLGDVLSGASPQVQAHVADIVREGFNFKRQAMTADSADEAKRYTAAADTCAARVKTILLAERVVAEETTAALVGSMLNTALTGMVTIAKGLLGVFVSSLAQGAISGITGGDGSVDLSSIFPHA